MGIHCCIVVAAILVILTSQISCSDDEHEEHCELLVRAGEPYVRCSLKGYHYRDHDGDDTLASIKLLGLRWPFRRRPAPSPSPLLSPLPSVGDSTTPPVPPMDTTRPAAVPPSPAEIPPPLVVGGSSSIRAVAIAVPVTALVTIFLAVLAYCCYRRLRTPRLPPEYKDDKPLLFSKVSAASAFNSVLNSESENHKVPVYPGFPVPRYGNDRYGEHELTTSVAPLGNYRSTSLPASMSSDADSGSPVSRLPPLPSRSRLASPRRSRAVRPYQGTLAAAAAAALPVVQEAVAASRRMDDVDVGNSSPPGSPPTPPLVPSTSPPTASAPSRKVPKPPASAFSQATPAPLPLPPGAAPPPPPPPVPPGGGRPPPPSHHPGHRPPPPGPGGHHPPPPPPGGPPPPPGRSPAPPPGGPPPPPPPGGPRPPPPPGGPRPPPPPPGGPRPPPPPPGGPRPPPPPPGGPRGPPPPPGGPRPPPPGGPRPPPLGPRPPPGLTVETSSSAANKGQKLKPLFWDKIKANPDHSMVWDNLSTGSFRLDEDTIETLFAAPAAGDKAKAVVTAPKKEQLIDARRAHNMAIQIRALGLTREEVFASLLEGDGLSVESLEALSKMAPNDDEERRLRNYKGPVSDLGPAEQFLLGVMKVPFAFQRIHAMLYKEQFVEELSQIEDSLRVFKAASVELKSSRSFKKLLQVVLMTGNKMNMGTYRGDAQAFKLNSLLKLSDVKSVDGKTTLLHFIVQEVIRAEARKSPTPSPRSPPVRSSFVFDNRQVDFDKAERKDMEDEFKQLGTQVILGMNAELENVRKATGLDIDVVKSAVYKLVSGLQKVDDSVKALQQASKTSPSDATSATTSDAMSEDDVFCEVMSRFVESAIAGVERAKGEYDAVVMAVKKLNVYFDADQKKDDVTAFQIFNIVSQFLVMLERACKDSFNKKK